MTICGCIGLTKHIAAGSTTKHTPSGLRLSATAITKVQITGLEGTYVVIQIQQLSEEAWSRDYEKYGTQKSDKFTGKRSLKIYCIPSFKKDEKDTVEYFVPPVQPVSVIRKSGPQTAYVTDNEDPKFQGRVRIAFPWQSLGNAERDELDKVNTNIRTLAKTIREYEA